MTIYTLGYSGWKIEDVEVVLARLDAILVDVRMVPRSRAPTWNGGFLGRHFPAMTLVAVTALVDPNARVEIEAEAVLP